MEKDRDFKNPLLHYTSTTSNASTSFSTNKNIRPTSKQIKQFCFPQLNKIAEKKEKKTTETITKILLDLMVFMRI